MPNLNYEAGGTRRAEYDRQFGTAGQSMASFDQSQVAQFNTDYDAGKFNNTKDSFTNGSSSTPNTGVSNTGSNAYNSSTAQQAALTKQEEINKAYGTSLFDTPNEFAKIPLNERWEPSFLQDNPTARVLDSRRDTVRNEARQQQALAAASLGFKVNEVEKEQKSQRMFEAITLGGRAGGITNSGLIEGMRTAGKEFIEAVRADGQMSLAELKARHSQMIFEVDTATANELEEYISVEQAKGKQKIYNSATGGWIANIDDASLLKMARDYDMDEVEVLSLKSAVQLYLQAEDKESAKKIVQEQITKAYKESSPAGYDVSGSLTGAGMDINGNFNAGKARDRVNGAQCGGYVNDSLNLWGNGSNMGNSYENKMTNAKSKAPIELGYFVESTGYIDPKTGIHYGHTGVVESVSPDGKTIRIHDYNAKNNEKERVETWNLHSGPDKAGFMKWEGPGGKIHYIGGFGQGNLKVQQTEDAKETVTEVVTNNYKTVETYVAESTREFPQVGNYETILKSKSGFTDQEIIQLASEASQSGSLQNALLTKVFNQQQIALPQKLLDAQPKDTVAMAGQLLQMYGANMPADEYVRLAEAGVIDEEAAAVYANSQLRKEESASASEQAKQIIEAEELRLEEAAIQQRDLASQRTAQTASNKLIFDAQQDEAKKIAEADRNTPYFANESEVIAKDYSDVSISQELRDSVATKYGIDTGLSEEDLIPKLDQVVLNLSQDPQRIINHFSSNKVPEDEIPLEYLEIIVNSPKRTAAHQAAYDKLSGGGSEGYNAEEIRNKLNSGQNVSTAELNFLSTYDKKVEEGTISPGSSTILKQSGDVITSVDGLGKLD